MELNELVKNHYTSLYQYALKLTRHTQKAEDLTQDTLVKIHKGFPKFRPNDSFSTWSKAIMRNCHIDTIRKGNRKKYTLAYNPKKRTLEDREVQREFSEILNLVNFDLLGNHITELQRTILYYSIFLSKPYTEIGKKLGITTFTISLEIKKVREQIRNIESFK